MLGVCSWDMAFDASIDWGSQDGVPIILMKEMEPSFWINGGPDDLISF